MALTKKTIISFGFTLCGKEFLKYMTPEHLLVIRGNTMYVSKIGGCKEDDCVICIIDNLTNKQFSDYMSKTINGYVKRYRHKNKDKENESKQG